jgi:acyl-CoA reductase-like NAD-dependent aldehyde dehydrogenase
MAAAAAAHRRRFLPSRRCLTLCAPFTPSAPPPQLNYLRIGKEEGAQVLVGGERAVLAGDLTEGYYVHPTVFKGTNDMRVFQEEIFGPVVSVTTFKTEAEAIAIANTTCYGLGAGIFTRDINRGPRVAKAIKAGRVVSSCGQGGGAASSHGAGLCAPRRGFSRRLQVPVTL